MAVDIVGVSLANPPHVKYWLNTIDHVQLYVAFGNNMTGEGFVLNVPMQENDSLVVDCNPKAPTVKLNGVPVTGALWLNTQRDHWMTLLGADNNFSYTCLLNAALEVTINVSWYNRMVWL